MKQLKYFFVVLLLAITFNQSSYAGRYFNSVIGRWTTPDPMQQNYPGWSPYNYTLDNPIRYTDPTGQWVASYDSSGNIVNVQAEKGDNLAGLYNQLSISAEDFAKKFNISDMANFEVIAGQTTFNITDFVLALGANTAFSVDPMNMNCFSSCLVGTGVFSEEVAVSNGSHFTQEAQSMFGLASQSSAQTGSIVTWVDNNGITHHAAIYVIMNQSGQQYFLGRPGLNSPVMLQNSIITNQLYPQFQINYLRK